MHFLVFVPDTAPSDIESIAKVSGLTAVLGGHDNKSNSDGPNDQTGTMLFWPSPHSPLGHFNGDEQTWIPSIAKNTEGKPYYWVGTWNDKPPVENEIRRHYTQSGNRIKLGAETWKLPTPDTVDSRAVYQDDGSMRWQVIREFSWVCDEAESLRSTYLDEFGTREMVFQVDPTAQIEWLLKLLQINYRILPEVAVALDMWVGRDHLMGVFLATLGLARTSNA